MVQFIYLGHQKVMQQYMMTVDAIEHCVQISENQEDSDGSVMEFYPVE